MPDLRGISDWADIDAHLDALVAREVPRVTSRYTDGVAFVTFAYDIDGVSIEIAKYGDCIEQLCDPPPPIHCIGGNFGRKADVVLRGHWKRLLLEGADGWGKWDEGRWFDRLFREDMPAGSEASAETAREIWAQAVDLAETLERYIASENIGLLIAINVNSNPGNPSLALAIVLASERTGCPVLNNNHDFYWEGGKPAAERPPGEEPGPRDHFFRNLGNSPFFRLFQRLLPWKGRRWTQVNINPIQSHVLIEEQGFDPRDVDIVGTLIDESFFVPCTAEEKREHRLRMAHILSDGEPRIRPVAVTGFLAGASGWMRNQHPVVCGAEPGLELDIATTDALYLLQPTRVVERKRIERDWELIGALLEHPPFREAFAAPRTLTLHITGPVPIEHQADLERVLEAYRKVIGRLPESIASRLFQAFSVGTEDHPSLHAPERSLGKLHIAGIYKLADAVLFPSLTEGRGLPIPESGAAGVPIVCSRYQPEEVFAAVVGEHLPEEQRIRYDLFPEGECGTDLLDSLTRILLDPASLADRTRHNREVVRERYAMPEMKRAFRRYLDRIEEKLGA
ncbi:MAG: glycosyltransferase [Planctomycetota bacterium]|jgi:glycosyltransferase involved in cell wall biosynthesis